MFATMAKVIATANDAALRATGVASLPQLHVFRGDRLIGFAGVAPTEPGHAFSMALCEIATLAAAARADSVIVAWEQRALAALAGQLGIVDESAKPRDAIEVCVADPTQHFLVTYPFTLRAAPGGRGADVQWEEPVPSPEPDPPLPLVIHELLRFCWKPFSAGADEHAAAVYLRANGHTVDLTA
jgi:hypothetical protein